MTPWRPAPLESLDRGRSRTWFLFSVPPFALQREGGRPIVLGLGNAATSAAAKRRCWNDAGTNALLFRTTVVWLALFQRQLQSY